MAKKEGSVVSSVEFTEDILPFIHETEQKMEMGFGAAVRYLIKKGIIRVKWEENALRRVEEDQQRSYEEHQKAIKEGRMLNQFGERMTEEEYWDSRLGAFDAASPEARMVAESPIKYSPTKHGAPLTGRVKEKEEKGKARKASGGNRKA